MQQSSLIVRLSLLLKEAMKKILFGSCLIACALAGSIAHSKDLAPLDIPGTVGGVKVKMQPQLQDVNDKFREIYSETRTRTIKKSQPIIVAINDVISLHDGGTKETTQIISDKYTLLKSVDHIVLATFVALELDADQMLSDVKLKQVQELQRLSQKALGSLDNSGLKGDLLERQKQLTNMAIKMQASVLADKRVTSAALTQFCRDSEKRVMQNVDDAVADQLLAIDTQVRQWRKQLGPERWEDLSVVVVSGHMPRERNTTMQYFSKALKVKREGARLYYCEGLSEESDGLNLVGTHILDKKIAVAFFKDEWRMHRDLLSDGAAKYLSKHPPLK
ncbi:MAG TPA: hypothetical protein EYN91_16425 [Candidatus Melainabacteria bacterium]|nr:hypothetical protein [Candidatus Melainabacteria bacterium]